MEKTETIMLTPGTLRVSPRVLQASARTQLNHRSPEVEQAFQGIKKNLKEILKLADDYRLVFFPTTGRGGLEALISAVVAHPTLIVVNGRWAGYMADVAHQYSQSVQVLTLPENAPIAVNDVERSIKELKPEAVCFVSHETERGLVNPTKELVKLCKEKNCKVVVDAMSSVVIEETDFSVLDVDAFCFSASKGLRSLRDMGIVSIKESFADTLSSRGVYLDLKKEYERQASGLPRNPFSISSVLALLEASNELLEEGVEERRKSIKENMAILHEWARDRDFEWITKPEYLGWCTLPLRLPNNWTYPAFRAELLKKGYDVFYSYEGEQGNTFEVSTLGYVSEQNVRGFIKATDEILWP